MLWLLCIKTYETHTHRIMFTFPLQVFDRDTQPAASKVRRTERYMKAITFSLIVDENETKYH